MTTSTSLLSLPALDVPHDQNYRNPAPIRLDEDLLSRFGLYDAFQRQVIGHNRLQQQQAQNSVSGGPNASVGNSTATAINNPGTDADSKKERKKEKDFYKTLFKNLPGKTDTKKDRYLSELIAQPPKEGRITLLDENMAEMAFTIYDIPQPLNEDEENKKRKKKRKREDQASPSVAPTPAHLPTPGGPPPLRQTTIIKHEPDLQCPQDQQNVQDRIHTPCLSSSRLHKVERPNAIHVFFNSPLRMGVVQCGLWAMTASPSPTLFIIENQSNSRVDWSL